MKFERTLNFDDPVVQADHCRFVRQLTGEKEVIIRDPKRSLPQNRRYWVAVVEPLSEWLTSTQGVPWSPEDTHEYLKTSFLPTTEKVDPRTGEVLHLPMSTTLLRVDEFSILMQKGEALIDWFENNKENENGVIQQSATDGKSDARPSAQVPAEPNGVRGVRGGVQPKVQDGWRGGSRGSRVR